MAITVNGTPGISASAVATLSNKTLEAPIINNATFTGQQAGLQVAFNDSIVFEGTTADAYETTLSAGEPTADRTVTLPNATDTLVGKATTDTLTNKSISLTTNTISGTTAEFNTALSDGDFATLAGSETLSNKTLTTPKFADSGYIADANGNELIGFPSTVASAVNQVVIENAATGDGSTTGQPIIRAQGNDTNISLNLVAKGSGFVQAGGVPVVTTTGTQTLTNKTLTSPVISTISNSGTVTLPTATDTLVGRATTDTLTNKTLTSPTINGAFTNSVNEIIVRGLEEDVNVVASAATGTINFDVATASIWYYTSNATANHTLNFRYDSGNSLSSKLAVGDAITVVWMNTNGSTAYYPNTIQIDGSAVTPKVPAAISAGNASAIDVYSFTIIKTAATPTYTVLETQTKFA